MGKCLIGNTKMAVGDVLIELEIKKAVDSTSGKFTLRVQVVRYQNIIAEIFVFSRNPTDGLDYFSNVSSPSNLTSYPKNSPAVGNVYFLEHTVELEFNTVKERDETLELLLIQINNLKKDWELVRETLTSTYNVIIS